MTQMDTKMVYEMKIFLPWQDEDEERWLIAQAARGLHLEKANLFGSYTFRRGEPRQMTYRLDFNAEIGEKHEIYLQLFRDAGWEYVGAMGNWQYFRKATGSESRDEIFTDPESKARKYQRALLYLWVSSPMAFMLLLQSVGNASMPLLTRVILGGIGLAAVILYTWITVKVLARVRTLKQL